MIIFEEKRFQLILQQILLWLCSLLAQLWTIRPGGLPARLSKVRLDSREPSLTISEWEREVLLGISVQA